MATNNDHITVSNEPPRLHALVIGIDNYPSSSVYKLAGAVADAKAMESYLIEKLGVPKNQIITLLDSQATRDAMVSNIQSIESNPRIEKDDPILIFFAGHGATAKAPAGWDSAGSEIQLILPYDYDFGRNADGTVVSGIPDRSIAVMLDKIASRKGDNITVILDCCHSGSGTRDPKRLIRGLESNIVIPKNLDLNIWRSYSRSRTAVISTEFLTKGLRSHVLLAACGAKEKAVESLGRGVFTVELLEKLQEIGADRITYSDLIQRIGILDAGRQNPQCEGHNRRRLLFGAKTSSPQSIMYALQMVNGEYVINAGSLQGITKGAAFSVHKDHTTEDPLGFVTAEEPGEFTTIVRLVSERPSFQMNEAAFALPQAPGHDEALQIYIDGEDLRLALQPCLDKKDLELEPIQNKNDAIYGLSIENGALTFNILDRRVADEGLDRIPFLMPIDLRQLSSDALERLEKVFRAAIHHHWHLRRTRIVPALRSKIEVEFIKLKVTRGATYETILVPDGPNLIENGKVDFVVNERFTYGIKITNDSPFSLYPYVFFLGSDLTVETYYHPGASGGKTDVPLPPNGSITIGYGDGGGYPISFTLDVEPEEIHPLFKKIDIEVDVGFLKIFLATEAVDLINMEQSSPFDNKGRGVNRYQSDPTKIWHTIIIPVIQRRKS